MTDIKYRTCNLCEALCGLTIEVENNEVVSIKGDKDDIFSKGHICPKAMALKDLHEDPDRLRFPLVKVDGQWQTTTWDKAIEYVAANLYRIQNKYGYDSLAVYQGNPSVHNLGTSLFSPGFIRSLNTRNRYSATSVDQLAHHLAAEYMFGHMSLIPVPDIIRTDFWLILGANPLVSNGSLMTAPNCSQRIKDIQLRGGKVVVVDPRRTETARKADQHLFIRPGTDIWLILAMIYEVLSTHQADHGHLLEYISPEEIEEVVDLLKNFNLKKAAKITGISEEKIHVLTKEFITAKSAVCYGRLGVSATKYGGLCHWAINTLNIITGNFDKIGGAMFANPAIDLRKSRSTGKRFRRWKSRVRELPEFGGELPASTLAEDILVPGDGQIKALLTSCGNPVLSVPNGKKLDHAFASLEFMVSIDIYLNETTRHADVILPPATGLETAHYGIAFHNLAIHNTAKYSPPTLEKKDGTLFDWEIFSRLQQSYERHSKGTDKVTPLYDLEQVLGMLLASGSSGIQLEHLKLHPHGIDLGALSSGIPERIQTQDRKILLIPDIYKEPLKELLKSENEKTGLLLIGRRHLRSNNSWLHNSYRMVKGKDRCTLLIHPNDAKERKISTGDKVLVSSKIGQEEIIAEVSDEMMIGTVSIPHGWGHHRKGVRLSVAQSHAGISLNDLVDDQEVDTLSGVSVINGIPVEVNSKQKKY